MYNLKIRTFIVLFMMLAGAVAIDDDADEDVSGATPEISILLFLLFVQIDSVRPSFFFHRNYSFFS